MLTIERGLKEEEEEEEEIKLKYYKNFNSVSVHLVQYITEKTKKQQLTSTTS